MLKKLLKQIEDYILPRRCCTCLKMGTNFCPSCRTQIKKVKNFCWGCGKKSSLGLVCLQCRKTKINYEACFFLASNEDYIIEKSLSACKFKGLKNVGFVLGKILGKELMSRWSQRPKKWKDLKTILIPCPMSRNKRNKISFSPADIIAQGISQMTDIEVINRGLRIKQGFFQKETSCNWQGESLEKTLCIIVNDYKLENKKMSKLSYALKKAKAEIVFFISLTN